MFLNRTGLGLFASVLFCCGNHAFAQSHDEEPAAIIELGTEAERSIQAAASSLGPTVAVEITPVEHWLEIEIGVTPLFNRHSTEWEADLLFKKPWSLFKRAEFMVGLGPQWAHTSDRTLKTNSIAGEVVLDFMFWPSTRRRFGWYLEPGYSYSFAGGHEQTLGISGGLLIAIP